jgi:hypothetical protein
MMGSGGGASILSEILDHMADMAVEESVYADIAVERFSADVDRLLGWLPPNLRPGALELARAHGYCTQAEIEKLRRESHRRH